MRKDYEIILRNVEEGNRVLDVGCGSGELMEILREKKGARCRGIEIDSGRVSRALAKGLSVVQGDALNSVDFYPDRFFDLVILSQTLQTVANPNLLIKKLMRIGRKVLISFPNFGHWKIRTSLMVQGKMPKTKLLSYTWHDTPNIHHLTIKDFEEYVLSNDISILKTNYLTSQKEYSLGMPNFFAEYALYLIEPIRVNQL